MPLITISRSFGCGGTTISRQIAEGLNLELYDDRRLQQEAMKLGIRSDELKSMDEKAPGFFDRIWGSKPELYLDLMEEVIYGVAKTGHGVILGHGSQMLLREFGCALHVLVYASESARIQHIMDQYKIDRKAAEKMIHKSDHEREGFLRYAFNMDWQNPSLYDLIINTDKVGIDMAAKLIMEAAGSQEIKQCSLTALEAMEKLSLTKKIQAELIRKDFSPTVFHVEVPEKGVAQIRGWTATAEEKKRLMESLKGVSGVSEVQDQVVVLPTPLA